MAGPLAKTVSCRWPKAIVAALLTATLVAQVGCSRSSSSPLVHQAYIWQREWSAAVVHAIRAAPGEITGWRVLLAEVYPSGAWHSVYPDITALLDSGRPLTGVLRIDGRTPLQLLPDIAHELTVHWATVGATRWSAVEIDYDCPTRMLGGYVAFLIKLREVLPHDVSISVTVLPTWIGSNDLPHLIAATDRTVLQVHSVLNPRQGLFDPAVARRWIRSYAALASHPFLIALPDYGSRVSWDPYGRIIAISSESNELIGTPDSKELQADPVAVETLLRALQSSHPKQLYGVVWFRLPVDGDQRIWSTETWTRVIRTQPLSRRLELQLEPDSYGTHKLVLENTGSADELLPRAVVLTVRCAASDGEGPYSVERQEDRTVWRRASARWLPVGHAISIGWSRCGQVVGDFSVEK